MDESPKRFDRIVAILIQLQSKKIVKAHEMAERFEVSLRTIYRDIRTLEAAGIPIYSEAGIGYSLMDGYRLPPVMFTREEASSFIAAEKLMQRFTDKELGDHYASAMYKLKSVLKTSDKDWITTIESKVLIRSNKLAQKAPSALAAIFSSIAEKTQVVLVYQALGAAEETERTIEPVGVFHDNNNWYIFGYCHLRKEYRQFRTDRIRDIKKTDFEFTIEHNDLETYLQKEKLTNNTKVRIIIDKKIAKYINEEKRYYGHVAEKEIDDQIEMTFMCRDIENGFSRWYLMFGDYARIIEPERLKTRVLELLEESKSRLLEK